MITVLYVVNYLLENLLNYSVNVFKVISKLFLLNKNVFSVVYNVIIVKLIKITVLPVL
jgi:hypothetical protein